MLSQPIENGSAVVIGDSNVIGLVRALDRSAGFAWVLWPDQCGLTECQPLDQLQAICNRQAVMKAIQVISAVRLASPLERAFLGDQSQRSDAIIVQRTPSASTRLEAAIVLIQKHTDYNTRLQARLGNRRMIARIQDATGIEDRDLVLRALEVEQDG